MLEVYIKGLFRNPSLGLKTEFELMTFGQRDAIVS